jgi:O-antigen/teichoic acid export membrane protein
VLLSGVAVLALIATLVVLLVFFHIFDVPAENVAAARWAILVLGINLAVTFPISVFDGVLWGLERFDLLNVIDIPTAVVRTGLTFWLVRDPGDVLALACITFLTTAGNEIVKAIISFRVDRKLRLAPSLFRGKQAVQLYGYGLWQFLLQIARQISGQIGTLIVGSMVAVSAVTPFSIAGRLVMYASQFMVAATGVLTPLATALHAKEDGDGERRLFLEGGRWCTAFAVFVVSALLLLGQPLLLLWIRKGEVVKASEPVLILIVLGELLPMSQWLTYSIIMGKARHRAVAISSLVEGVIAAVGGAWAAKHWGILGVCGVFAVAAFLCRGVFQVWFACRVLRVGLWRYVGASILLPLVVAVLPVLLLKGVLLCREPEGWLDLVAYGGGFSLVYAIAAGIGLGGAKYLPRRITDRWFGQVVEKAHV